MLKVNDICYIIENCINVSKVEIIAIRSEFYTVKFLEKPRPSAASLRRSRLYLTETEAKKVIDKKPEIKKENRTINAARKSNWPCLNQNGVN